MPKFFIPVTWEQAAYHIIEAESLEAAQEVADNPDKWTGNYAHIDALPSPQCELSNNEWAISHDDIREATSEEVETAEAPSYKEALADLVGSLSTAKLRKMAKATGYSVDVFLAAHKAAEKALAA